jgi:hypothetical protein
LQPFAASILRLAVVGQSMRGAAVVCVEHNVPRRRLVAPDAGQESLGGDGAGFPDWLLDNRSRRADLALSAAAGPLLTFDPRWRPP